MNQSKAAPVERHHTPANQNKASPNVTKLTSSRDQSHRRGDRDITSASASNSGDGAGYLFSLTGSLKTALLGRDIAALLLPGDQ